MRGLATRAATLALAAAGVVGVHGCTERLEGGNACPILCPGQTVELRDTLIAAVVVDSSLAGFPPIGEEPALVLAARGEIGRASCRERGEISVVAVSLKKERKTEIQ